MPPGRGACWSFVAEKAAYNVFGLYPYDQRWRPALALILFAALASVTLTRRFWSGRLLVAWPVVWPAMVALMGGGLPGLPRAETRLWGGLPVTVGLTTTALVVAYPLGLLLALGRGSRLPVFRVFCVGWIELVRGVPLVSILVMTATVLPLFLPEGITVPRLVRAQVAFAMFASAYLAEVFRGGFLSVPKSQYEAAESLGLSSWHSLRLIVLPQALTNSIPGQVNTFIVVFKDTTLVLVIGIFDFFTTVKSGLGYAAWLGFSTGAYLFAAFFYFVVSFTMSRYSQHLERMFRK